MKKTLLLLPLGLGLCVSTLHSAAPAFRHGVNISHWLSQNYSERPYGAGWFNEEDVAWIAAQGFDHIRFPIDGRELMRADGSLDEKKLEPFDRALHWTKAKGLGAILDMHFLPGADFNEKNSDKRLFEDAALMDQVAAFWAKLAKYYAKEGDYLRFELLNEPVARENSQVNVFTKRMLSAIRESNPTRIVYIPCNRWNSYKTIKDVEVPADPNIAITFHFYEPMIFSHQRASWVSLPPDMPLVPFPGKVPDLAKALPAGHRYLEWSGRELSAALQIDPPFAMVAAWAKENAKGREIYLGEFGAYKEADPKSTEAYVRAVRQAAERNGFSWAIWDYRGGFGVRDEQGQPSAVFRGLFDR
jgi:endoglucanase